MSDRFRDSLEGYEPTPSGQISDRIIRRASRRKWRTRLMVGAAVLALSALMAVGIAAALPSGGVAPGDVRQLVRELDNRLDATFAASNSFAEVASSLCERAADRSQAVVTLTDLIPSVSAGNQAHQLSIRVQAAVDELRRAVSQCAAAGERLDQIRSRVRELQEERQRLLGLLDGTGS